MATPIEELNGLSTSASKAGVPLYQLLGGPTRTKLRALRPFDRNRLAVGKGTILLEAGATTKTDAAAIAPTAWDFAVRCPAGMPGLDALALAKVLEPYVPSWISHPDAASLRRIAAQTTVPVAAANAHLDLLRDETADLLLLDLAALGIKHAMALAALAETHYAGVVLANCTKAPWQAAGLHLAAALPNFLAIECGSLVSDRDGYVEVPR